MDRRLGARLDALDDHALFVGTPAVVLCEIELNAEESRRLKESMVEPDRESLPLVKPVAFYWCWGRSWD